MSFGHHLKSTLLFKIQSDESLCTFMARTQADSKVSVREVALEADKSPLKGTIRGQKVAYEGMLKLAQDSIQRAHAAEAVCRPEPNLGHPRGPSMMLAKNKQE